MVERTLPADLPPGAGDFDSCSGTGTSGTAVSRSGSSGPTRGSTKFARAFVESLVFWVVVALMIYAFWNGF
jgi:hypothetical protein